MSEIPETPTASARALIGWFAGALAFECVHQFSDGHTVASIVYGIGAITVAIFDYYLPKILGPKLTASLNRATAKASLWIGVAFVTLLLIALSPYVEEKRWPFSAWFQPPPQIVHVLPTQEAIDIASQPKIEAAQQDAKKQIEAAQQAVKDQVDKLTRDNARLTAKIEAPVWQNIEVQMRRLDREILSPCDNLLTNWREWVKANDHNSIMNASYPAVSSRAGSVIQIYIDGMAALSRNADQEVISALDPSKVRTLGVAVLAVYQQAISPSNLDETVMGALVDNVQDAVRTVRTWQSANLEKAKQKIAAAQ
jgi:hypothetical protein